MARKLTYEECYNIAKKYVQKQDFITHDAQAYNYAYRHKWLQDYTWLKHIPKKEKLYQQCYEAAQKCKTLNEFKESYKELYDISVKYFFLKRFSWLSNNSRYEHCYNIAKKYTRLKDFRLNDRSAYVIALNNNWLGDYTWLERVNKKTDYKWSKIEYAEKYSYENCLEISKQYRTIKEFKENDFICFNKCRRNGWLKDCTWLDDTDNRGEYNKLTYEECYECAKQCETKSEMRKKYWSAFRKATLENWFPNYTWFNKYNALDSRNYCVYVYEDIDNKTVYIGLTKDIERRHRQHRNLIPGKTVYDNVKTYFLSKNKDLPNYEILTYNLTVEEAQFNKDLWIDIYLHHGWTILNKFKTNRKQTFIGRNTHKWTKEICLERAKKYNTLIDFMLSDNGAYQACCRNNWMQDLTWLTKTNSFNRKPVAILEIDEQGNTVNRYNSITEAVKKCGITLHTMRNMIHFNQKMENGNFLKKEEPTIA